MSATTETDAVAKLALAGRLAPSVHEIAGRTFLVLNGDTVKEIEPRDGSEPPPALLRQTVTLEDRASLVAYLRAFGAKDQTRVFASLNNSRIEAVLDYHAPAVAAGSGVGRQIHRAILPLQIAEEWKRWTERSGKMTSQVEFARFLEENAADVKVPAGADLLEIARDLYAVQKADFRQAIRLDNSDMAFEFTQETDAKSKRGDLSVPTRFRLEIPVIFNEELVPIDAFLRWRIADGSLTLGYELHRVEYVRQAAVQQVAHAIAEDAGFPVHLGVPR